MKTKEKVEYDLFFSVLEENNIIPNFWMSKEYFEKANFKVILGQQALSVKDEQGCFVFPIIRFDGAVIPVSCWSSFAGDLFLNHSKKFLDYEFIFNPAEFEDMSGGKWSAYRKNVNRFMKKNPKIIYEYYNGRVDNNLELINLFLDWILEKEEEFIIEDDEVIVEYLVNGFNRKVLRDESGEIIGVNVWDENYKYINFRYSFCKKSFLYLSEYLRYCFYIDPEIKKKEKLVNDGGVLGLPSLYRFKKKMNPIKINTIYGWEKKNG